MMTLKHEHAFRINDILCEEYTGHHSYPFPEDPDVRSCNVFFGVSFNMLLKQQLYCQWYDTL